MKLTTTHSPDIGHVKCLVHSESGNGKTFSIRSLPTKGTTIALCERSPGPLRDQNRPVIHLETFEDVRVMLAAFRNPANCQDSELRKIVEATRILVIDSLSEVSELCMEHIVEVARPELIKERTGKSNEKPSNTYEDLLTMEDYQLYRKKMLSMISAFCHLPVHIVMTALSAWHRDKDGGERIKTPNLAGKSARECAAYFDLVFYLKVAQVADDKVQRQFQTQPDGLVLCKGDVTLNQYELADWTGVFKKYLVKGKADETK